MFEASQLKGCTITTFPDQNKILPLLGFLPTAADPPDEVWSQVRTFLRVEHTSGCACLCHCHSGWRCFYLMHVSIKRCYIGLASAAEQLCT